MSDDPESLERRFRDTGSLEDHARWIEARACARTLPAARVCLAADLGHVAARRALSRGQVRLSADPSHAAAHRALGGERVAGAGLLDLVRQGLSARWDETHREWADEDDLAWTPPGGGPPGTARDLAVRVALAAARAALPAWVPEDAADARPRDLIDAVAAWTRCPCPAHAVDPHRAGLRPEAWQGPRAMLVALERAGADRMIAQNAAGAAGLPPAARSALGAALAAALGVALPREGDECARLGVEAAALALRDPEAVERAVAVEVGPWLLAE